MRWGRLALFRRAANIDAPARKLGDESDICREVTCGLGVWSSERDQGCVRRLVESDLSGVVGSKSVAYKAFRRLVPKHHV